MDSTSSGNRTCSAVRGALAAAAVAASLAGCGGGDSGAGVAATQLAFTVAWEQPEGAAAGASASAQAPGEAGAANFGSVIPPTVNAIRFTFRPAAPAKPCCISVLRGSQEFIDRRLVLADVTPGLGSLEVNGYYSEFAPADGVTAVCPTRPLGQGDPCVGNGKAQPSFTSGVEPIEVLAGETNIVDLQVVSLPFVIDLDPEDGGTADDPQPFVRFAVVDANHEVSSDIDIEIRSGETQVDAEIVEISPCQDNQVSPVFPPCSEGDDLEVRGQIVEARSPEVLPGGIADLRITARNNADPPRSSLLETTFDVPSDTTTSTTTSSSSTTTVTDTTTTSSSSTTTTTSDTTTSTTLVFPARFCVAFSVSNTVDLTGISFDVDYSEAGGAGNFVGSGEEVSCFHLLETNPDSTLASFNDEEGVARLHVAIISAETFSGPIPVAQCEFEQIPPLDLGGLVIDVLEATDPDLLPANATVVVEEVPCPL